MSDITLDEIMENTQSAREVLDRTGLGRSDPMKRLIARRAVREHLILRIIGGLVRKELSMVDRVYLGAFIEMVIDGLIEEVETFPEMSSDELIDLLRRQPDE